MQQVFQSAVLATAIEPTTLHKTHIQSCKRYIHRLYMHRFAFYIILTDNFLLCLILSPFFTVVTAIVLTVMHATYSVYHLLVFSTAPPPPTHPPLLTSFTCYPLTALHTHNDCSYMLVPHPVAVTVFGGAGRGWSPDDTKFH